MTEKDIISEIEDIFNMENEINEVDELPGKKNITIENGYYSYVTSIFIDIRESTKLFNNNPKKTVAKIVRCFATHIINIIRTSDCLRESGTRGDCVYGVYASSTINEYINIMKKAIEISNFIKILNKQLTKKGIKNIKVGIGLSTSKELVVKACENTKDLLWIGKAVTIASKLCDIANKGNNEEILISDEFHNTIKENYQKDQNKNLFKKHKDNDLVYYGYVK